MSEEVKIKISQPMFEVGELERFDNNIHSIVEEYSKLMFKEKDQILTQRIIMKQEEEIERLNNIIDDKKERQDIAIRLLHKLFGTGDYEINYIIGIINGQRQIKFDEILDKEKYNARKNI